MLKTRLLLTLTLAVTALATATSTASATFVVLNLNTTKPIKIHAQSSNDIFIAGAGEFRCEEVHYYGIESSKAMETNLITASPEYKKCTATDGSLKGTQTIKLEGCTYTAHQKEAGSLHGRVSLLCPKGQSIHLNTGLLSCVIKVGPTGNQNLEKIQYSNKGGAEPLDVEIEGNVEGITYTSEGCELGGIKEGNNAKYTVSGALVRALDQEGSIVGIHVL